MLGAIQNNPAVDGTLANRINVLNSSMGRMNCVTFVIFGQDTDSYLYETGRHVRGVFINGDYRNCRIKVIATAAEERGVRIFFSENLGNGYAMRIDGIYWETGE